MSQKPEIRSLNIETVLVSGLRFLVSALAVVATSACGFHPLYGEINGGPGAQARFETVYVPPIDLENYGYNVGYNVRNDLLDVMHAKSRVEGALYDLQIVLADRNEGIGIQNETIGNVKEVEITRYNYTLTASYQLVDRKTRQVLTKGTASSLSAYDVVTSPYATQVAQQDAEARTAQDIARQLQLRLAVYFAQHPVAAAK